MAIRLVGVVERRQPLPPGRYWITVYSFPSDLERKEDFFKWKESNAQTVIVDHEEALQRPRNGVSPGVFSIFTVLQATPWLDAKRFGFPNVAGPEIQTAKDTSERPPPESVMEYWKRELGEFTSTSLGRTLLVTGLAYVFLQAGKDRRQ